MYRFVLKHLCKFIAAPTESIAVSFSVILEQYVFLSYCSVINAYDSSSLRWWVYEVGILTSFHAILAAYIWVNTTTFSRLQKRKEPNSTRFMSRSLSKVPHYWLFVAIVPGRVVSRKLAFISFLMSSSSPESYPGGLESLSLLSSFFFMSSYFLCI